MRERTLELLDSLSESDLDKVSAKAPKGLGETFGTYRLCLQFVADHWYMHRGQLADARRAAGLERMPMDFSLFDSIAALWVSPVATSTRPCRTISTQIDPMNR